MKALEARCRWRVFVRENDDSCVRVETYDHVMVCTGPYRRPKFPVVRGMDKFRGRIMHMHQYRTRDTFIGKKVLVIGKNGSSFEHVLHNWTEGDLIFESNSALLNTAGNQTSALEAVVEAAQCTRPVSVPVCLWAVRLCLSAPDCVQKVTPKNLLTTAFEPTDLALNEA